MRKVLSCILLFTLLFCLMVLPTEAETLPQKQAVWDDAGIFNAGEESELESLARRLYDERGSGFVVITTLDWYSDAESELYERSIPSLYGGDYCAIVIFVSGYFTGSTSVSVPHEFETYTEGSMTSRVSDGKLQRIMDHIESDVKTGDTCQGVKQYFEEMASAHKVGKAPRGILIGAVVGVIAGLIMFLSVKISYGRQSRSPSYPLNENAKLYLTEEHDHFRNRFVTRTVRSSSSSGGGGRSGGGGGGRSGGRR